MVKRTKRQHTVPQMILKGFAKEEQLRTFNRQSAQRVVMSIKDASVVGHIYDMPAATPGWEVDAIEKHLADRESQAAPGVESVRAGLPVAPEDKQALSDLIAFQLTRTSGMLREVDEMGDWYGKVWFEGIGRKGIIERFKQIGREATEEDIEEVLEFTRNMDQFRLRPPKGTFLMLFLQSFLAVVPYLAPRLWNWVIVHSERPFITSDAGVTLIGNTLDGGLGLPSASEVWLPLAMQQALVLTKSQSLPPLFEISTRHTQRVGQRLALEADRWLFGTSMTSMRCWI